MSEETKTCPKCGGEMVKREIIEGGTAWFCFECGLEKCGITPPW